MNRAAYKKMSHPLKAAFLFSCVLLRESGSKFNFMTDYKTHKVGKENIRYLHKGSGKPLIFLHGLSGRPSYYSSLLSLLAEHFETVAPLMYGINYLNEQPTSIDEYAELTLDFCSSLKVEYHCIIGHSMGGAVAFRMGDKLSEPFYLIAINPVLPIDYGHLGFSARAHYKNIRASLGIAGGLRSVVFGLTIPLPTFFNLLRNVNASIEIISDIRNFNYQKMHVTQPSLILYGENDEFFDLDGRITEQINRAFDRLIIKRLNKLNHDWPIFYPKLAAREISDFLR